MRIQLQLACFVALMLPMSVFAGPVAVTAPIGTSVPTPERITIHEALAAGLRNVPDVDPVLEVLQPPPDLTAACLDDRGCLERVMIFSESPALVTGTVTRAGDTYTLDMVYFSRGIVIRRQEYTVPTDPGRLATAARALTYELVTGQPAPADALAAADPEPPAKPTREKPPKAPKVKKEKQAKAPKAPKAPKEPKVKTARAPRPAKTSASTARVPKAPRTGGSSADEMPRVSVVGRLGWSRYYVFDFVTVGAEARLRAFGGLHVIGGAEVYAVNREVPSAVDPEGGMAWNAMVPWNVGAIYAAQLGPLRPYAGADVIFVKYNRDADGLAVGGRGRFGADLSISDRVALNLNIALGAWTGSTWERVDDELGQTGFLPQISAGTVIAF